MITDDVWRELDPHAGRVPPPIARRWWIIAVTVSVLAFVIGAAWWAGAVTPRLRSGASSAYGADRGTIFYGISVRNAGSFPATIVDAGRSGAGLELTSVDGQFPVTLRSGEETWIELHYRVTDCAAVTSDPWPVPVTVERPWGAHTVHLALPTQLQSEWQGADLPPLPVVRSGPVEWQRSQADVACATLG